MGPRRQVGDTISAFVRQWGCDAQSEASLRKLRPEQLAIVLSDFDPPPNTHNINGKLSAFLRSVLSRSGGRAEGSTYVDSTQAEKALEEFATGWGLDEQAIEALCSLPEGLRTSVLADFDPPKDTQNPSGKLMAFIRLRSSGSMGSVAPMQADELQDFAATWGLDEQATEALRILPEGLRNAVMTDFDPPQDTQNPSGKLMAFIRTRTSGSMGSPGPVQDFAAAWGLDEQACEALRSLPEGLRNAVMTDFDPPQDTQNPSGKLMAFIRTRSTGSLGSAGAGAMKDFAAGWGLDEQAFEALRSLPEDLRNVVMLEFDPPRDTQNPSGKLMAFIRRRTSEPVVSGEPPWRPGGGGYREVAPERAPKRGYDDPLAAFLKRWGLDSESEKAIRQLPEELQQKVLDGFQPPAETRNPNAKLAMWIRTLQPSGSWHNWGEQKRRRLN